MNAPGNWNWVIACTDDVWFDVISRSPKVATCCAFTIIDKGYTYFRGTLLMNPLEGISPGYMVAHELGQRRH